MKIRQTSLLAYEQIHADNTAQTQKQQVLQTVRNYAEGLTRNEIAGLLCIRINAVCGRVNQLLKDGLLYEDGKRIDHYSNKSNYILRAR